MPPKKKQKKGPGIQWQWRDDEGGWVTYGDDDCDTLERAYKGEAKRSKVFTTTDLSFNKGYGTKYTFDFNKWTQLNQSSKTSRKIRRLHEDTDDDDDEDDDDEDEEFEWQWKDDNDLFVAFYDDDTELLEKAYRKSPKSIFTTTKLSFNADFGSTYEFNFKKMTQTNTDSDTQRKLRRVRKTTKGWDMSSYGIKAKKGPTSTTGFPPNWAPQKQSVDLVTVHEGSKEYNEAVGPFMKTLTRKVNVIFLKRIQNYALWQFYSLTRGHIADRNGGDPNEKTLFHGARIRANMDAITNFGFDMRVAAAGSVGSGIYFAVNASYSDGGYVLQNPDKSKEMFICKVALGSGVQGNSSLRRPPPKDPKKPTGDLHDSVFNGAIMHVVFNNSQAYPMYLLKYK